MSDTIEALDLAAFYAPYEGDGRRKQPYEPTMMLKVLIYGYATGVFSSRRLAQKLHEDVAFRVLAAGNFPAHRTFCEFRRRHLGDFEAFFVQIVRIAAEVGFVKMGTIAIDGSKVKANAGKHKAMSYGRMQDQEKRLRKEIQSLTRLVWRPASGKPIVIVAGMRMTISAQPDDVFLERLIPTWPDSLTNNTGPANADWMADWLGGYKRFEMGRMVQ